MTDRTQRTFRADEGRGAAHPDHRRRDVRFEVLGRIAGSVASLETLQLVNLGISGALVEGGLPLPPNAEFRMQLVLDGHVSDTTVKIRRVSEVLRQSGTPRYRIALEFLTLSSEAEEAIKQLVNRNQAQI